MGKEAKTNAMRILDKNKIPYEMNTYTCDEFIDGCHIADQLGQPYERSFKTLVTVGKSENYFVFAIPVDKELNLKAAAKAAGEKNVELIHVKDINAITGYIRGGCSPVGMKKQYVTVFDESCLAQPTMLVSGGRIGTQIECAPADLIKASRGKTAAIAQEHGA